MSSALNKMTVEDFDVKGKRVLVRCDFNVKMENGVITSDSYLQTPHKMISNQIDS